MSEELTSKILTIVCVYNEQSVLNEYLLSCVDKSKIELVLIDNSQNIFSSASLALNSCIDKINTEYVLFAHQDIKFLQMDWLERLYVFLRQIQDFGVLGVAGKKSFYSRNISKGVHGHLRRQIGDTRYDVPVEALSVDECAMIFKTEVFKKIKFDSVACADWHLYGADFCYSARRAGLKSYILPIPFYHRSEGLDIYSKNSQKTEMFFLTLARLLKKHHKEIFFATSTGVWITFLPLLPQRIVYIFKRKYF